MKTQFSLPDDTSIRYTRTFAAPVERMWAAYTDPAVVRTWMLGPDPETEFAVCDMDVRDGGSFRWVWRDSNGELEIHGDVVSADPPHRIVTTEFMGGTDFPPTHNVVEFTPSDEGTLMTGTITYVSKEARDGAYATGMADGMDASYNRLADAA